MIFENKKKTNNVIFIFREVMEFTDEIRKSEPVKFALQVFSAVQENNYSRFFKLMM